MRDLLDTLAEVVWDSSWRIALLSAALGVLLWGWFAYTLSPIERYYFPAYVRSSLHIVNGDEPDSVAWLVKTRAKQDFEIAEPEDVVPSAQGAMPFALSPEAVKQGWTGATILRPLDYQGGSQRAILQDNFFGGRSLGWLLFQPAEILVVPLALWASFVRWRYKRQRERARFRSWDELGSSWAEDVAAFTGELYGAVKHCAVSSWQDVQTSLAAMKSWQQAGSVSPSVAATPEKVELVNELQLAKVVVVPSPSPQPMQPTTEPTTELSRAQTLPFRKRQVAVQSGEKWDQSKWID